VLTPLLLLRGSTVQIFHFKLLVNLTFYFTI